MTFDYHDAINAFVKNNNFQSQIVNMVDIVHIANKRSQVDTAYTGKPLIGIDLDHTMIYSSNSMGTETSTDHLFKVTEMYQQKPLTYMTDVAHTYLEILNSYAYLCPVTTRTQTQFSRVKIPGTTKWDLESEQTQYAVTTNGAVIIVDGEQDLDWKEKIESQFSTVASTKKVDAYLSRYIAEPWLISLRDASDYYHYMVVDLAKIPEGVIAEMEKVMESYGWGVSLQGRKIYFIPHFITKGNALAEVARRSNADYVMSAGDSVLDQSMLLMSDLSYRPRHGQLEVVDYMIPRMQVTEATGIQAGEELTAMFLAQVFNEGFL